MSCALVAHAQSEDSVKRLRTAKQIEIIALRPSDLPTIDPRGAEIKPSSTLYQQTGSYLASDALRAMSSSLDIRRYGTLGAIAIPSFRGLPAEYTIVYRDGIRLTNEQLGETDFGQLTMHGLSHIELIPASSAVLLGGDAIGAAINLVSASADSNALRIGSEQTSYATSGFPTQSYYTTASVRPSNTLSIAAGASLDQSSGAFPFFQDTAHSSVLRENNDASLKSANASVLWLASDRTTVRATGNYFSAERGSPGKATIEGRGASSLTARQADMQDLASIRIDHDASTWQSSLDVHYGEQFESYIDSKLGLNDSSTDLIGGLDARAQSKLADWVTGYVGLDYLHTGLTGSSFETNASALVRHRIGGYVAAAISPTEQLRLAIAARTEYVSDIKRFDLLPQVSLEYDPIEQIDVSAAYSRSVHVPTLNDLYYKLYGNPGLRPESADNYQIAGGFTPEVIGLHPRFSVTYFSARITNEIIWQPDTAPGSTAWYPFNIGMAALSGWELRAEATVPITERSAIRIEESYTILDARNRTPGDPNNGNELVYSSPTSSLLLAELTHEDWGVLTAFIRYRGHKFTDAMNSIDNELPPVTTLSFALHSRNIQFARLGFVIGLNVDNVTDQHYQEALHYPLPGRTYKFSIEFHY